MPIEFSDTFKLACYSGLFIFMCTSLGASFVFILLKHKNRIYTQLSLGFSAGIMLAASIFSLIIPAIENSSYESSYKMVPVIGGFILGILFLIAIDKSMPHLHVLAKSPEGPKSSLSKHTLLFLAITIHNIPEGMAVGVSAATSADLTLTSSAAILALGIGIQNIPEGAAVSMPYFADGMSRMKSFLLGSLSGAVEPAAAILVVLLADLVAPLLPWFLSFAAGAMMYVVIEELIPQSHDLGNSDKGTIAVLTGFILMMFLDVTLG
ncbi:ZIP family metal transporter [Succinivibrio dextrinosolvens]|uniref:Zinc transporter, ZIP family n=1 Tax=Succinivibrio dextrinosolvens TaxID=83771 RepID=A0A662ZAI2_9GAMM|nr:ZIP family metal transporter [Succinivibrio dextrinosolvens]SFK01990.1 zinc transporter, ZIP family [Succinivibrio dextrinosolvens]